MKTCKKGFHRYEPDSKHRGCPECRRLYLASYRSLNRVKCRRATSDWYERNAEKVNSSAREWQKRNPEKVKLSAKKWQKSHASSCSTTSAFRRAAKLRATPPWLTIEDLREIKLTYQKARDISLSTGVKHHVDHEIPLKGEIVSGLHVPWNLRVIPASDNIKKKNKLLCP